VYLGGAAALLLFATRLSLRIRRLRDEAEHAIDSHGRVTGALSGSQAADEVGDLSRSFAQTLDRLRQYTSYLEQLRSRLSHELRTPVAVVRSSLDNLTQTPLPEEAQVYVTRAEEGLDRLNRIISRMSEATRLEHTLATAEQETFDLREVVQGCIEGYRLAHPGRWLEFRAPPTQLKLHGAPDLVAQLLDKLVANALEFGKPGTPVTIELREAGNRALLSVRNEGPPLPHEMQGRLFESMVSARPEQADAEPHLGLGLYIVRLIAEFHRGRVSAGNRADISGVEVTVELPLT
jgi:signal transduction histidine kinase